MPRFFLPPEQIRGNTFVLTGPEARHAVVVLRKKPGDTIDLFDGRDRSYRGRIESVAPERIAGTLLDGVESVPAIPVAITLYQALLKGSKWDWLVEKACEIGVRRVVPILTARTVIPLSAPEKAEKSERWNRIALAASKQCGRADVMHVETPRPLDAALAQAPTFDLILMPWEKESQGTIGDACRRFRGKRVGLFIGPEGGWDAGEVEKGRLARAVTVRLGPTLLRSETAGIVAAALVLNEFGVY